MIWTNSFKNLLYPRQCLYLFREDVEVDLLASKIAALFHLSKTAVEDETLIVQADIELKSRAHGQFLNLLIKGKLTNHEEMCFLLDCIIWLY